ncbi:MAG TPA: hypothetical protein VH351_20140 [Bryobacteraceae bacterium]|jgi:autotransporter translocation and assembly factor TamB|nr:hypothetical protein [Bryobacteraceae bacterium]
MKIRLALLAALLAVAAFAADVNGKWTAEMQGREGQTFTTTFNLKTDGDKVTGTVNGRLGDAPITNGKISGDNISFDVVREFNGNSITLHYNGTVSADTIKFKVDGGRGPGREVTAKRASA